jgi:hypothetical protein
MLEVKVVDNGDIFYPGHRYMVNIVTGNRFPFSQVLMDANKDLREYTPTYHIVKDGNFEDEEVIKSGDVEPDIVIKDTPIDVNEKDLTPTQKRKITIANKNKIGV